MTDYELLSKQMDSLLEGTEWIITNLANASALIWDSLNEINWAGFYILRDEVLCLGPFQGKPACTVIGPGKGVCGAAAASDETQLVYDVHQFPGHIACDSASNSEIVIPLHKDGEVWGVLDIDSPITGRFTEEDKAGLERVASIIEKYIR
jgi:GAF domain-containing protein